MYSGAYIYVQCKCQSRIKHTIKQFQSSRVTAAIQQFSQVIRQYGSSGDII